MPPADLRLPGGAPFQIVGSSPKGLRETTSCEGLFGTGRAYGDNGLEHEHRTPNERFGPPSRLAGAGYRIRSRMANHPWLILIRKQCCQSRLRRVAARAWIHPLVQRDND